MAVKNKKRVQKDSVNIKGEDVFKAIDDLANWLIRDGNPLAKQFTADVQDRVASADSAALTDKYLEDFQAAGNQKSKPNDRFIDKALNALPFLRAFLTKKQFLAFGNPAGKTAEQRIVEPLQKKAQEEQLEKEAIRKAQEALSKLNEKKMIDDLKNPESEIRKGLGPNWFSLWLAVFAEEQIALMLMRYYADNELAKLDEMFKLEEGYQRQVQSIQALIDEARNKKVPNEAPISTPMPAPTPADLKIQQLSDQIEQTKNEIKALKEKYLETRTKSHEKQMKTIQEFDTKLDDILKREIENAPDAETREQLQELQEEFKTDKADSIERNKLVKPILEKEQHPVLEFPEVMMGIRAMNAEIQANKLADKLKKVLPKNTEIDAASADMKKDIKETIKTQQGDLSKIKVDITTKKSEVNKLENELKTPLEEAKNAEAKAEAETKAEEASEAIKDDGEASLAKPTNRDQSLESVKAQQVLLAAGEKLVIQAKVFEKTSVNAYEDKKKSDNANQHSLIDEEEDEDDIADSDIAKTSSNHSNKPDEAMKTDKLTAGDADEKSIKKQSDKANQHSLIDEEEDEDDIADSDMAKTETSSSHSGNSDEPIKTDKSTAANQTKIISNNEKQWEKKPSNLCAYPPTANRQDGGSKSKEPVNSSENLVSRHL